MAKNDWLPNREDEMLPWFNNFDTKLPEYAVTLDLSPADLSTVVDDSAMLKFAVNTVVIFKAEQKEWVDFKNLELYGPPDQPTPGVPIVPTLTPPTVVAPGLIGRTRALVVRIKAHPAYTEVIGEDLGIIGAEQAGAGLVKPDGKAEALPAHEVRISFVKHGHEGVDIESQRAAETAWSYLAFDGYSPHIDNRQPLVADQPEERRYRLRYRDKDVPVGEYSDVYVVTTGA